MNRGLQQIEADIEQARAQVRADERAEEDLKDSAIALQDALDRRIRDTFAAEFAAIAEARQRVVDFDEQTKPARQRLYALETERKRARMVPGQEVIWQEPNGWRGTTGRSATVLRVTDKRVQIDLGGIRYDRVKWVSLDSLSIREGAGVRA